MSPSPASGHQRLNDKLGAFFDAHWEEVGLGRSYPDTGVKRPGTPRMHASAIGENVPRDYRIPDRSFLVAGRYGIVKGAWIVGAPDVVLEILSPRDESVAKLPWYFALGVREAILLDARAPSALVYRRGPAAFEPAAPEPTGFVRSDVLRTELRFERGSGGTLNLAIRRSDDRPRARRIPVE